MATFNEKTGEILLTQEDKDALRNGRGKKWAKNIMDWILWNTPIPEEK